MRTTIELPDALVNQVEIWARQEGRRLNDAMADLLRKGLAASGDALASTARPTIKVHPETGLPYVECPPDAPARRMTVPQLLALEYETIGRDDRERSGVSSRQ